VSILPNPQPAQPENQRTDAGTVTSSLLSSRDSRANKEQSLGLESGGAADRVGEVRVSTIDDDVALFEERLELLDEAVDGVSGLDEEDDLAGRLELLAELLDRVRADNRLALGLVLEEVVDLGRRAVVSCDGEALVRPGGSGKIYVSQKLPQSIAAKAHMLRIRFWPCAFTSASAVCTQYGE
jgi:hypothetical protein